MEDVTLGDILESAIRKSNDRLMAINEIYNVFRRYPKVFGEIVEHQSKFGTSIKIKLSVEGE